MANNFKNAIKTDVNAEQSNPTEVFASGASTKAIAIEFDAANKSSAGVTITVQIEDTSASDSSGTTATLNNATDTFTTSSAHSLAVNDRLLFTAGTAPAVSPADSLTNFFTTRIYYVQSVPSATTFKIATTRGATTAVNFSNNGNNLSYKQKAIADIVRDAPIPVGGALKVISGQKLVLEATDRLLSYCSSANSVDVVASVLDDVS